MRGAGLVVAGALGLSLAGAGFADAEEALPEEERLRLAEELAGLKARAEAESANSARAAAAALQEALGSDTRLAQLYTEAVRAVEFRGRRNAGELFQDWRKKNEESLGRPETRAAIRWHARYLLLTLKARGGAPRDALMEELLGYAAGLEREERVDLRHPLLARPFAAGPLARLFDIRMPEGEWRDWVAEAGNTGAMFERLILPWMRERKDARLLDYWQMKIEAAARAAEEERGEFRAGQIGRTTLPRLRWARARDLARLGRRAEAAREMMGVLRANPGHPDFKAWAREAEELLAPPPGAGGEERKQ